MKHILTLLTIILIACCITSCGKRPTTSKNGQETVKVGFVSNAIADFWLIAKAGTVKAEKDFNAECDYRMPSQSSATEQKTIVEDIMVKVSGIAILPIDPPDRPLERHCARSIWSVRTRRAQTSASATSAQQHRAGKMAGRD